MSLASCSLLVTRQDSRSIALTRTLRQQLGLLQARTVDVRVGSLRTTVPLRTLNRKGDFAVLSTSLASALKLPAAGKCLIRSSAGRELQIGPLIGVLTSVTNHPTSPFGPRTAYVRDLMDAGKDRGFFFGFSPSGVNWEAETVTGYFQTPGGGWTRKTVPLPDVVYNRLPNRTAEKSASLRDFKERFVQRKIPIFNWSFFDKWDVYRLLDGDRDASQHVPDSQINPTTEDIRQMLERHRFLYLKPTAGSLGFGIYRLTHNPGKGYFLRYRKDGGNVLLRFPRFEGLIDMLRRQKLKMVQYVAQQGIRLIEIDGCPIDFRFHLTKNIRNEWVVSGIGAKKAGRGSVTTHVRTGGQLMVPDQVLSITQGDRAGIVMEKAKETAIKLAKAIEQAYPHRLGELGLDLGIDQAESIWMFEANSKPGRTIFKHPLLKQQGKDASANLFEHCLFLSRFAERRE
ncbi:YheC/YheD family protein [Gorillibacterium sp. CAU 1737]|uniref:YheC/YheD family endospore coat-associated protein n=1 Tax=Gorillibacterium sp. CAU 1737 TaxID=3140362 RepID=UPI003260EF70